MVLSSIPNGFTLFGMEIKIYGITSALSYLLGIIIACLIAKRRKLKSDDILTLACYVIPFAVIGARLYFVIFNANQFDSFGDIFNLRQGGLAFYGGLIGGAIAVLIYCLIHKKNFLAILDIVAPAMILSQALGRWGNFFNQEAYGYPVTNPNLQWFPFAVNIDHCLQADCTCAGSGWHLATFFYESLWNTLSFCVLMLLLYKANFKRNGMVACYYLVLYGTGRMIIEGLRTDSLYLGPLRVSQLLSAIFVILGLTIIIINACTKKKKQDSFDIIMKAIKTPL